MARCAECGTELPRPTAKRCKTCAKTHNRKRALERKERLKSTPEGRAHLKAIEDRYHASRMAEDPEGRRSTWRQSQKKTRAKRSRV